jgi:hypothetical protein
LQLRSDKPGRNPGVFQRTYEKTTYSEIEEHARMSGSPLCALHEKDIVATIFLATIFLNSRCTHEKGEVAKRI